MQPTDETGSVPQSYLKSLGPLISCFFLAAFYVRDRPLDLPEGQHEPNPTFPVQPRVDEGFKGKYLAVGLDFFSSWRSSLYPAANSGLDRGSDFVGSRRGVKS